MNRVIELIIQERNQFLIYLAVLLSALALTGILSARNPALYRPFFGRLPPLLVVFVVGIAGGLLFTGLIPRDRFLIFRSQEPGGLWIAAVLACVFAVLMVLFDVWIVLPKDINRPFPDALMFYPSIAFVVEIVLHVLPLAVFTFFVGGFSEGATFETALLIALFSIPIFEAGYQFSDALTWPYHNWVAGVIGLHVFFINLAQLLIFERYDFASMLTLRLVYYLIWHILWGVLRLRLLF